MRSIYLFLSAAMLLQACDMVVMQPVPVPVPPVVDLSSCRAEGVRNLIGQDVRLLPDSGSWASYRVIHPGQVITMDFSATRLNLRVDENGIIQSMFCG